MCIRREYKNAHPDPDWNIQTLEGKIQSTVGWINKLWNVHLMKYYPQWKWGTRVHINTRMNPTTGWVTAARHQRSSTKWWHVHKVQSRRHYKLYRKARMSPIEITIVITFRREVNMSRKGPTRGSLSSQLPTSVEWWFPCCSLCDYTEHLVLLWMCISFHNFKRMKEEDKL
jgi:hypothetical protein